MHASLDWGKHQSANFVIPRDVFLRHWWNRRDDPFQIWKSALKEALVRANINSMCLFFLTIENFKETAEYHGVVCSVDHVIFRQEWVSENERISGKAFWNKSTSQRDAWVACLSLLGNQVTRSQSVRLADGSAKTDSGIQWQVDVTPEGKLHSRHFIVSFRFLWPEAQTGSSLKLSRLCRVSAQNSSVNQNTSAFPQPSCFHKSIPKDCHFCVLHGHCEKLPRMCFYSLCPFYATHLQQTFHVIKHSQERYTEFLLSTEKENNCKSSYWKEILWLSQLRISTYVVKRYPLFRRRYSCIHYPGLAFWLQKKTEFSLTCHISVDNLKVFNNELQTHRCSWHGKKIPSEIQTQEKPFWRFFSLIFFGE